MEQLEAYLHTSDNLILRWVGRGELKGKKREDGRSWIFERTHVRDFALRHPEAIDLMLIDKLWLFDLLSNGEVGKKLTDEEVKRKRKRYFEAATPNVKQIRSKKTTAHTPSIDHPWAIGA